VIVKVPITESDTPIN